MLGNCSHSTRAHDGNVVTVAEEEERVTSENLREAESPMYTENRTRAQQRLCLVLVVTCYKLKRSKLTRRRLPTWNGFGPFSTQRTTTTLLCTKAWQSKRLRSAKNMKMVRNGWLLLGPQSLNGMALVQLHMVFSDDESFLTRFCWKRSCKSTRYAIYSTHRRFCCHHM